MKTAWRVAVAFFGVLTLVACGGSGGGGSPIIPMAGGNSATCTDPRAPPADSRPRFRAMNSTPRCRVRRKSPRAPHQAPVRCQHKPRSSRTRIEWSWRRLRRSALIWRKYPTMPIKESVHRHSRRQVLRLLPRVPHPCPSSPALTLNLPVRPLPKPRRWRRNPPPAAGRPACQPFRRRQVKAAQELRPTDLVFKAELKLFDKG